jgi:glycosyltransferase involved in cell wall biosynthesis
LHGPDIVFLLVYCPTGWQHEAALPAILAGMDVVVNPSLRAWSETFCIVNIEVMAMRVPLITFAVGGEIRWIVFLNA